jgi:RNA-directed DNA polymerase
MKRYGYLFEQIVTFDNLELAAHKTLRGHKSRKAVARLCFHLETEVLRLQEALMNGTYQPQPYRVFEIREPKPRQICAADVQDRVAHHALCNIIGPIFEARMISDTFACRKGKGTHAAIQRTQHFAQRFPYFLQCDIRKYFAMIDHDVLRSILQRKLKDERVLALLDRIIDQPLPGSAPGKGVPIGNLTSQYFANIYLGELDHFVKERLRVRGYVRYMDDFLIFGATKPELHETHAAVRAFVAERLRLDLKAEATILAPVTQGISFLGFRVFPALVRLSGPKWARFRREVKRREEAFAAGKLSEEDLAR